MLAVILICVDLLIYYRLIYVWICVLEAMLKLVIQLFYTETVLIFLFFRS